MSLRITVKEFITNPRL